MNLPASNQFSPLARRILVAGGLVIIIFGLRMMAFFWNSVFLALVITITLTPLIGWLKHRGLPRRLAYFLTIVFMILFFLMVIYLLAYTTGVLIDNLSQYQTTANQGLSKLESWLVQYNIQITSVIDSAEHQVAGVFQIIRVSLEKIGGLFGVIALAVIVSIFILGESSNMQSKLNRQIGSNRVAQENLTRFTNGTRSFIIVTTLLGFVGGMIIAIALALLGIPDPIMWGFLFWILNYIPYIGIWMAVLPPALIAWTNLGAAYGLLVLLIYGVVKNGLYLIVQPKLMGEKVDTTMTLGLLSLFFWGWVFGAIGMVLAYPYTLLVRDVWLANSDSLWLVDWMRKGSSEPEQSE